MKKYKFNRPWEGYAFLTPWILGFLLFTAIPMVLSLYFSFTQYDVVTSPKWIGLKNYIDLANDPRVHKSLQVTFTYVALGVPFQLIFALLLAAVFKNNIPGIRIYRAIYYLPSLFGGSVAVAILWRQLFNKEGAINQLLSLVGIEGKNWIASPDTALYTLILLLIWQFGSPMVIFLGGLKQISPDYYEAAEIDGASKVGTFFHITLPLLTPMVFFNIVMTIINAFQAFTPSYIISGGTGAPVDSTLFYTLYLYIKGFQHFSMGYASALAWVLLIIIAIITAIMFLLAQKWVYYDE
ncbi:carbohydrate ABC transporter permease [Mahella australiensis]|uniref:Carbohydrate ABC transporter membrane protein 1, CUT1 family n=1 Tax=Mahella australiensis (strain DSM 15567 / CIP 107919 / 50-1 BON) TaxID=697281 RepID=F3ZWQ7_MAHA5|nr:sugar ABC transporter permease [Mahella australiensis]AEE96500.1 carbohydrate ABC transporter membrane protein 1, CUT1 family [Mahella australiensis 50-1 BON]